MTKYIVGYNVHGYRETSLNDEGLKNNNDSSVVIVISSKTESGEIGKYYKLVDLCIKNNRKVILISTEENNKVFKALARLMTSYRKYDIYYTPSIETVNAKYLETLESREPDFSEVQTFIGGDITAYADASNMIYGLESLVSAGDTEGLKVFFEQHKNSIEELGNVLDYMKSECEQHNSQELLENIDKNKIEIAKLQEMNNNSKAEITKLQDASNKGKEELEVIKRKVAELKSENDNLKANSESGVILNDYNELNLSNINYKVKRILYFKEISYVPYTNTLVKCIFRYIEELLSLNVKLLIYDNRTSLYNVYNPLIRITGKTYSQHKDTVMNTANKVVVAEPLPNIINDIVTNVNPITNESTDVLIIYDRMKNNKDIVKGNNITKYFVMNSSNELDNLTNHLHINDTSKIITRPDSNFAKDVIDIPCIEGFKTAGDDAKFSKYLTLASKHIKEQIIRYICTESKINDLAQL